MLGKLAEGGLTEIFLARARGAGAVERFVVLKRLKRMVTSQVDLVKLFLDEARLAAQLQHPNVAQVFEVGKLGGSYFFAMEFVNGETLQALMTHARSRKIQVPVRAVLTIAAAMAAGLHHAHDRKGTDGEALHIVHGDVSPTNTLVSQEGIVKLIDFGVEKAGEHGGAKIGPYSSPEQCNGQPLDRRSDLFSLGVVLWELLTLESLYHRATDEEVKTAIETEEPPKPSAQRYDVPPELDAMVQKLLAKNPDDRFRDADELLAEIEALAQKLGILLSTADLSRMMRLWFGTKSEPSAEEASPPVTPVVVNSEEIPDDLAIPIESPVDEQLESVRGAAALIAVRALARSHSPSGRQDKPSVPPELMDNPHENFEQVRDRILARARQKRETARNQIAGVIAGGLSNTAASADSADPGAAATGLASTSIAPANSNDRHTRTTAPAPISLIEAAVREAGLAEPVVLEPASSANGRSASTHDTGYTPDKVVVDEEAVGALAANGVGREAPPVSANVATTSASAAETSAAETSESASSTSTRGSSTRDSGRASSASGEIERQDSASARSPTAEADERADREARARREEAVYARASTAEIVRRPPPRPAWVAPVLGIGTLTVVVLVVMLLRGEDKPSRAHANADQTTAQPTNARPLEGTAPVTTPAAAPTPATAPAPAQASEPTTEPATAPASTHAGESQDTAATTPAAPPTTSATAPVTTERPEPATTASIGAATTPTGTTTTPATTPTTAPTTPETTATHGAPGTATPPDASGATARKNPDAASSPGDRGGPEQKEVAKKDPVKKPPVQPKPAPAKGIEELFAAGEFAKTNTACTSELVFTPAKLEMCALAACETRHVALAKRWIKAIAKASRPPLVDKCRANGVEIEESPPAAPTDPASSNGT